MTRTLTVVSHTHWDREWYQPFQEYRLRLVQLIDRLLDLLDRQPAYRCFTLDGQTILLEDYLEVRPNRREKLQAYVQQGRLQIGPWYILPDEFLVSPEATIRNLILGDRVARQFGPKMQVGYIPDSFGHISQLPQIFRGFGLDTAVTWRGIGPAPNEFRWIAADGTDVLTIHLRDGYGNAAFLPYDAPHFVRQLDQLVARLEPWATTDHLLAMNGTDHLEPMADLAGLLAQADAALPQVEIKHGTLAEFIAAVRAADPELETRRGELRSAERAHLLPGVFSSRMWINQRNNRCETLLEKWVEPLSALVALYDLPTPTGGLQDLTWLAWRHLLQNHPHDSICGCSVDAVHKEMDTRFDWVEQIGEKVTGQCLLALARATDTAAFDGLPLIVYNPTAGPRTDLVTVRVPVPQQVAAVQLFDPAGNRLPCEVVERRQVPARVLDVERQALRDTMLWVTRDKVDGWGLQSVETSVAGTEGRIEVTMAPLPPVAGLEEQANAAADELLADSSLLSFRLCVEHYDELSIRFVAPAVPGHGYTTFTLQPAAAPAEPRPAAAEPRLENEFFLVEVDGASGTLTLTDKTTGAVLPGLGRFVDGGDRGDTYNYCPPEQDELIAAPATPPTVRLIHDSPVRQTIEIVRTYHIPAGLAPERSRRSEEQVVLPITTQVSLSPGIPRLDFVTTIENNAEDHRLRVLFPTPVVTDRSRAEGHFDVVERPLELPAHTEDWPEQPTPTHPQRTFVDVNDGALGLLVANRGLPEYEIMAEEKGATVALTLLRCVGWLSRDDLHCREGHAGPGYTTPGAQCPGRHTFEYALVPHRGGWENAYQQAHALNAPLRGAVTAAGEGPLPTSSSWVEVEPAGFVLTALKRPEEGAGLIVRGYNITDRPLEVTLRLPCGWRRAARADLAENSLETLVGEGDAVRFAARPKEIVTLRFDR